MEKKKTIKFFIKDIKKRFGWNAAIGFWYGFNYRKYEDNLITYKEAIEEMGKLAGYTGAYDTSTDEKEAISEMNDRLDDLISEAIVNNNG